MKRRGATVSCVYTPADDWIEIYYLPNMKGKLAGVALADVNESPGKSKIHFGVMELLLAYLLYVIRIIIKSKNR